MKSSKAYTLDYRRKREGRTNYRLRLKILSSRKNRVVVRKSLNNVQIQIIKLNILGDNVLISASSRELIKYGWKAHKGNLSSAYLVGFLCGLKAKKSKLDSGVLDLGMYRAVEKSIFFSAVKGLLDAGFKMNVNEKVIPNNDRIFGKHIENYAKMIKEKEYYKRQFSNYLKNGLNPEEFSKHVQSVKDEINKKWQ